MIVGSRQYRVGSRILILLTAYFFVLTPLHAQDFSLELMRCRASLDMVIMEAGPEYRRIKTGAESISNIIESLREELNSKFYIQNSESSRKWEVSFRRKIACIHLSIKALKGEIDKYLYMGIAI